MLGAVSRRWAHRIPFIVKLNHNELLTYPNKYDQTMFGSAQPGVGDGRRRGRRDDLLRQRAEPRQIVEVSEAFEEAHQLGMFTVLWCYLRNSAFKKDGVDYGLAADLTGQANHLGVTIEADIIKQKMPEVNNGYGALSTDGVKYGQTNAKVYSELTTDHPIDLTRYQVANCYMGRVAADQQRRRLLRGERPRRSRAHRSDQQARRRRRPDQRPQGVPASDSGRHRAPERDPGRLSGVRGHDRLNQHAGTIAATRRPMAVVWASVRNDDAGVSQECGFPARITLLKAHRTWDTQGAWRWANRGGRLIRARSAGFGA